MDFATSQPLLLSSFILSMALTFSVMPLWIRACAKHHLFEGSDERKIHRQKTPSMGGIAIFSGILFSSLVCAVFTGQNGESLLYAGMTLMFFTGFFDDLLDLKPLIKIIPQVIAASLVVASGIRIESLLGLFGVGSLPYTASCIITVIFITAVTNAFNLIDGMDGLAGTLALIASAVCFAIFAMTGDLPMAILSLSLAGSMIAFLKFNFHPARVFMGDTGSLVIGFILAVLAVGLSGKVTMFPPELPFISPLIIVSVLFVPMYDVLRVVVIRLQCGQSPFQADRNHVHHMIAAQGFGQRLTTIIIAGFSILYIILALAFPHMGINTFIVLSVCLGMVLMNSFTVSLLAGLYSRLGGRLYNRTTKA